MLVLVSLGVLCCAVACSTRIHSLYMPTGKRHRKAAAAAAWCCCYCWCYSIIQLWNSSFERYDGKKDYETVLCVYAYNRYTTHFALSLSISHSVAPFACIYSTFCIQCVYYIAHSSLSEASVSNHTQYTVCVNTQYTRTRVGCETNLVSFFSVSLLLCVSVSHSFFLSLKLTALYLSIRWFTTWKLCRVFYVLFSVGTIQMNIYGP